jgi:hypothetical protein
VKFNIASESKGRGSFSNLIRSEVLVALMIRIAHCGLLGRRRNTLRRFSILLLHKIEQLLSQIDSLLPWGLRCSSKILYSPPRLHAWHNPQEYDKNFITELTEQAYVTVRLCTCIPKVLFRISDGTSPIVTEVYRGFSSVRGVPPLCCDMVLESRNSSLLGNRPVNRFPRKLTQATTEELPFLRNAEVNTSL